MLNVTVEMATQIEYAYSYYDILILRVIFY
jgi:hypothetical protein